MALLDIQSFMLVTGQRQISDWLKQLAVVLIPIALLLLVNISTPGPPLHVIIVGITSSIGLAGIDFIIPQTGLFLGFMRLMGCYKSPFFSVGDIWQ
jgi:hypothetical protein